MSCEVIQLIQAYKKLLSNNNELIESATKEIIDLTSDPSIINSLFQIIDESDESNVRMQAIISLKLVISKFKDDFTVEENQNLIELALNSLSHESFEIIQNVLIDIVYLLLSDDTFQMVCSFIENSSLDSVNAQIAFHIPDNYIEQLLPLLEPIVVKLLDTDINGILLGFRIRKFIEQDFFFEIFQKSIDMSILLSNDTNLLTTLTKSIKENVKYIDDKSVILDLYLPLIDPEEADIPPQNQLLYSDVISEVIFLMEISDTQTMYTILQKFVDLYTSIDENHDIFDFIETFASNSDFLKLFISKLQKPESDEKAVNASLLCLSHCFLAYANINTNFIFIDEIAAYLSKVVLHQSKSVRTNAGTTIKTFSIELEEDISNICPILIDSMIDSLEIEINDDIIEALTAIFTHSTGDEENVKSFFDKCFSFFLPKIQNNENMQHIYPSFVSLCAASRAKSYEYFDQIFEINKSIIDSSEPEIAFVQSFAVDGLKNLAIMCSDSFSDKISDLITYFIQILEEEEEDIELIMAILSAIGDFISKFSDDIDFPNLVPLLTRLVANNNETSPLALSTICAIIDDFIDKVDFSDIIQDILQYFQILSDELMDQDYTDKPILNLLRAMTLFVDYLGKLPQSESESDEKKMKNKSDLFDSILSWILSVVNQTDDNYTISEAISVLIEIANDYAFEPSILFPLFERLFNKDYDDDLFPTFSYFLQILIKNGFVLDAMVPNFFEMANSSNQRKIRDFGLQILGQIAESQQSEIVDETFLRNLVEVSLKSIHEFESWSAVFVLNQIAKGCSNFPNLEEVFNGPQLMDILLECLQSDKQNASYLQFADNCITSFASIVIHIVKDAVPFDSYLQPILERMPARFETQENFEMMNFFMWVGYRTDFNPPDLFLTVLVRFFSNPIEYDVVGFIADNKEIIDTLKAKLAMLMERVDDSDSIITNVCNDDQYKLHFFRLNIGEYDEDDEDDENEGDGNNEGNL